MQKNSNKASILIWAIFLSLIISVSFIQISTKINKNLQNNEKSINNLGIQNEINNKLNNAKVSNNYESQYLKNGEKLIFDYTNDITFSLWEKSINISKINTGSIVRINILEWWPVKYENNTYSWIINSAKNISVSEWSLVIENLGGYTKINLQSNTTKNNLLEYMNYKIIRKIWNKEIIQTKWKIKSF